MTRSAHILYWKRVMSQRNLRDALFLTNLFQIITYGKLFLNIMDCIFGIFYQMIQKGCTMLAFLNISFKGVQDHTVYVLCVMT